MLVLGDWCDLCFLHVGLPLEGPFAKNVFVPVSLVFLFDPSPTHLGRGIELSMCLCWNWAGADYGKHHIYF